MEIAARQKGVLHYLLYLIKYAHDELISECDLFSHSWGHFNTRTSMFDTNDMVVGVIFDINSVFC